MKHHTLRNKITGRMLNGLLASLLLATSTAQASEPEPGLEPIETILVVPSGPIEYPDPICLGCKIVAKRPAESNGTTDDHGVLVLEYVDALGEPFSGDLVLTVFLPSTGEWRIILLDGIWLADGETTTVEVPGGLDWSWQEVDTVMVRMFQV